MSSIIDMDEQLERWLADDISFDVLQAPLPDPIAEEVVEHLKSEADRFWSISPDRSYELASRIVAIGQARVDDRQVALGLMAQGDALKFLSRYKEAWEKLDQAGKIFKSVGDEVGWARTRIGRLYLSLKLNCVTETLADVERARTIFLANDEQEKLLRLEINTAYVHTQRGDQHKALSLYRSALAIAEALEDRGIQHLGLLHMNIGFAYEALGDFPRALAEYKDARSLFIARGETRNIANIELNIAYIAQVQGNYRRALRILYAILERGIEQFPFEERAVKQDLVECFLYLNRYSEARELAQQVISGYRNSNANYDMARTLLHLATAEAGLGKLGAAQAALDEATPIFTSLGAITWSMITRLRYGQVALKQGNLDVAQREANVAAAHFQKENQQFNNAMASMLLGQISLASIDLSMAEIKSLHVLDVARRFKVPYLRYAAYLLLGRIAEARSKTTRAIRCYQAAMATIERVQRRLTITLRPEFLEDKEEAGRELIKQYLRLGQIKCAFESLERAKSQLLLSYISNRDQFRWIKDDSKSQNLIDELEHLRAEHQWFYRLAHEPPRNPHSTATFSPEKALNDVEKREKRMLAITEQLYLHSSRNQEASIAQLKSTEEIQNTLKDNSLLIEYYNDGKNLWAFTLERNSIEVYQLPLTVDDLEQLVHQLQVNFSTALKFRSRIPSAYKLTQLGQRILQRLYSLLLNPLDNKLKGKKRLTIVPYGALHYIPFNLLYDDSAYQIEHYEIVTLPASNLATHPVPKRTPGSLILSHSLSGRLPQTHRETQLVYQLMGGKLYTEETATRMALRTPPSQILHIAAHGQHRLDQPDLSYLQLADGQLYTDDLLQQDLSYELVTLSGCETGRAHVSGGDELIGLGRGLLYAGAGALILSLWRVADSSTVSLMEKLYRALKAGNSKAAALRKAQLAFLDQDRQLHPAFWGAFQLIGDPGPLSKNH